MKSCDRLVESIKNPGVGHRPMQIIHGFYPRGAEEVERYIENAKLNRIGGFVINFPQLRAGDCGSYLEESPEADAEWQHLRFFAERCLDAGLGIWIYDENAYPSGAAGSRVVEAHPEYRVKALKMYSYRMSGGRAEVDLSPFSDVETEEMSFRKPEQRVLFAAAYPIASDAGRKFTVKPEPVLLGKEVSDDTRLLTAELPEGDWLVCMFYCGPADFLTENRTEYTDVMDRAAVERFVSVTHKRYAEKLGNELMTRIGAFFTDEPGLPTHGCSAYFDERFQNYALSDTPVNVAVTPWNDELEREYLKRYGAERLIELFADVVGAAYKQLRRSFWCAVRRMFSENYFGTVADFCEAHGSRMTGHLYGEETLSMQVGLNAGLFAHEKRMQLPGVDRLYAGDHSSEQNCSLSGECFEPALPHDIIPEKTASSAAHIMGRREAMSESSFHLEHNFWRIPEAETPENRLNSAYYQCQLGITQIASYYHYPNAPDADRADFHDRTARAFEFCTAGVHCAELLVLAPETAAFERYIPCDNKYWLVGPCITAPGMNEEMVRLEYAYGRTLETLLDGFYDFDITDEEELRRAELDGGRLVLGEESYSALVYIDGGEPEESFAAFVRRFIEQGGKLVIVSVDEPSDFAKTLEGSLAVKYVSAERIADELEHFVPRETNITAARGIRVKKLRAEERELYFVHNRTDEPREITLVTERPAEVYAMTGELVTHSDANKLVLTVPPKDAVMIIS